MRENQWKPNVTVASIIQDDLGRFLMVEEHTEAGLRFNQPAGHLEAGESLLEAVIRETREETAHVFVPQHLVGIYQGPLLQGNFSYLRFAFGGHVAHKLADAALDKGIVRALWMSMDDILATQSKHRSYLVLKCIQDALAGISAPLTLIRHYKT